MGDIDPRRQWYQRKRWRNLREKQLKRQPWCVYCEQTKHKTKATVVDHIAPHKGDTRLFYNPGNLQSLCKQCHDSHKQRLERSGKLRGCDEHGNPLDPNHHWNES